MVGGPDIICCVQQPERGIAIALSARWGLEPFATITLEEWSLLWPVSLPGRQVRATAFMAMWGLKETVCLDPEGEPIPCIDYIDHLVWHDRYVWFMETLAACEDGCERSRV